MCCNAIVRRHFVTKFLAKISVTRPVKSSVFFTNFSDEIYSYYPLTLFDKHSLVTLCCRINAIKYSFWFNIFLQFDLIILYEILSLINTRKNCWSAKDLSSNDIFNIQIRSFHSPIKFIIIVLPSENINYLHFFFFMEEKWTYWLAIYMRELYFDSCYLI